MTASSTAQESDENQPNAAAAVHSHGGSAEECAHRFDRVGIRRWLVLAIAQYPCEPQGHAAGRYAVETADGRATVTRTDAPADLTLTAETLSTLYLGAVAVRAMHRAGRVAATGEAAARFGAMADLAEPPYCLTGF